MFKGFNGHLPKPIRNFLSPVDTPIFRISRNCINLCKKGIAQNIKKFLSLLLYQPIFGEREQ